MCDVVSKALSQVPAANRRRFLQTAGLAAAAGGLGLASAPASAAARRSSRTRVVLLGTAGGPTILSPDRLGVSTAVVYGDHVYVVDLGHGAQTQLIKAGLHGAGFGGTSFTQVRGIFLTHLHSDHMVEWPAVYATAGMNAVGRNEDPIRVFGPGDRGSLVRVFPPGRPAPGVFSPEDPTPGIEGMTAHLGRAFAQDFNDRARDSNFDSPDTTFDVRDIGLDGLWDVDPEGIPPRLDRPIHIWQDGDVRITATLVDHRPTAPAFGYRFDTPDGSVVVSGDTCVSANLIDLAQDCDYLVHEVIDPQFADDLAAVLPPAIAGPVKEHLLASHTTIESVGRDVAERAGVKNLVLTHLVPSGNPQGRWMKAKKGYSGRVIVGRDLLELNV